MHIAAATAQSLQFAKNAPIGEGSFAPTSFGSSQWIHHCEEQTQRTLEHP